MRNYVINSKNLDDDLIVIAGDNLFDLSLLEITNIFNEKEQNIIVLHDVKDLELAKHYGVVQIDENKIVVNFEEKPNNPKSTLISTGIYIFPKKTLPSIKKYIDEGIKNSDLCDSFYYERFFDGIVFYSFKDRNADRNDSHHHVCRTFTRCHFLRVLIKESETAGMES